MPCCSNCVVASREKPQAILNFHNSVVNPPWYSRIPEYLIDLMLIHTCAKFVTVSNYSMQSLARRRAFEGCQKLDFILNGIADPLANYRSSDGVYKSPVTNRYCLMLATYEKRKGHAFLLEAFKEVVRDYPDVSLQIYGYGKAKERNYVAGIVAKHGLHNNVLLADFNPDTTMLIVNSALLVVPSQEYESFGLTIIEAMAIKTPVIATDVGGIPEILMKSSAGFICSHNDVFSFAAAMKKILGDNCLATELGRNGRKNYISRFTATRMAERYQSMLTNLN